MGFRSFMKRATRRRGRVPAGVRVLRPVEQFSCIVRCKAQMKRIFSSPISALVAGAALRLLFALKFPSASGNTLLYYPLATNWLQQATYPMNIEGKPVPVNI